MSTALGGAPVELVPHDAEEIALRKLHQPHLPLVEGEGQAVAVLQDLGLLLILFSALIVTGVVINYLSTFVSVNKYLSISEDKLYI